jgi:hypothetical protein
MRRGKWFVNVAVAIIDRVHADMLHRVGLPDQFVPAHPPKTIRGTGLGWVTEENTPLFALQFPDNAFAGET